MNKLSTWSGADAAGDKSEVVLGDGAPIGGDGGLNNPTGDGAGDVATAFGAGAGVAAGGVATGEGAAAGGGVAGGGALTGGGVAGGGVLTGGGVAGGGALTGGGVEAATGGGEVAGGDATDGGGEDTAGGGELAAGGGDEAAGGGEPVGAGVVGVGGAGLVVGDVAGAWPPTPATIRQRKPIQRAFFRSIFYHNVFFAHSDYLLSTRVEEKSLVCGYMKEEGGEKEICIYIYRGLFGRRVKKRKTKVERWLVNCDFQTDLFVGLWTPLGLFSCDLHYSSHKYKSTNLMMFCCCLTFVKTSGGSKGFYSFFPRFDIFI